MDHVFNIKINSMDFSCSNVDSMLGNSQTRVHSVCLNYNISFIQLAYFVLHSVDKKPFQKHNNMQSKSDDLFLLIISAKLLTVIFGYINLQSV